MSQIAYLRKAVISKSDDKIHEPEIDVSLDAPKKLLINTIDLSEILKTKKKAIISAPMGSGITDNIGILMALLQLKKKWLRLVYIGDSDRITRIFTNQNPHLFETPPEYINERDNRKTAIFINDYDMTTMKNLRDVLALHNNASYIYIFSSKSLNDICNGVNELEDDGFVSINAPLCKQFKTKSNKIKRMHDL